MGVLWKISEEDAVQIAKEASRLAVEYAYKGISYLKATEMLVEEISKGNTLEDARNGAEKKIIEGAQR